MQKTIQWNYYCFWKIMEWSLQITHLEKENDLNQTYMRTCSSRSSSGVYYSPSWSLMTRPSDLKWAPKLVSVHRFHPQPLPWKSCQFPNLRQKGDSLKMATWISMGQGEIVGLYEAHVFLLTPWKRFYMESGFRDLFFVRKCWIQEIWNAGTKNRR